MLFSQHDKISEIIKKMKGAVFLKFANRSAKDASLLDRKIVSVKNLIMLVKMSEYLT